MVFECGTVLVVALKTAVSRGGSPAPCVMIKEQEPTWSPRRDKPRFSLDLRCDSSRQVLLVLVVVYIVVAIHRPAPAPVKNDHCSRLPFDTRHPQDSQQCQRSRCPPIARRSRDYLLIAAMGLAGGRGYRR
jgi:hypothetical protein